jgi:poly(A) polymerase/tRNA nucleotidyltransferase (CCA-adding enzyme)
MTDSAAADPPALRIDPPPFLRGAVLTRLFALLPEARVVGGAVRDALAGRPVADIDLASPLPPRDVMRRLRQVHIRVIPTGLAHGTVTAVLRRHPVEITTLRRDVATDGRHAEVAFTADWRQDAARRDFTINALSMTPDGAVYDYFGGVADLRAGIVRFVGDPAQRIAEDYLRVLRYMRFYARYAAGPPDDPVRAALRDAIPGLARLSVERVWSELRQILATPDPMGAIALMAELGILAAVIPEGTDPPRLARLVASRAPPDPLLRLAALLVGDVDAFADRLKLSGEERRRLLALRATPLANPGDDDATLRRLLADHDRAALIDRTRLDGEATKPWAALRARLAALPQPVFPLEGRDVVALGVPPGKRVGALVRALRAWWLEGGCVADAEACRVELTRRV